MVKLLWSGIAVLLLLSGCGWNGTPTRKNNFIPLTSIEIVAVPSIIAVGTSTKLTATGNYSGQYTADITDQVVWSSDSNAEIVTAVSPRRAKGKNAGTTAHLTATMGSISANYTLTVTAATVTAITISPATPSIAKGSPCQFTANGIFSDSTTQDLTYDATWTSSAASVASISDNSASKGFAQTIALGTTIITAAFDTQSVSTPLTVTPPVLLSIAVTPDNPSLLTLSTTTFTATGTYTDGTRATGVTDSPVTWSSSNPAYATISSPGGVVKTLTQGTTTITAALGGKTGTSNLKVTGGNLTGISFSSPSVALVKGTAGRLTATGTFSNGTSRDITGSGFLVWAVADTAAATVTTPVGSLVWLNANAVTSAATAVTAKYDTFTATTLLTVTDQTLSSITISPTSADLIVGSSSRFTATGLFSNGASQDVTTLCTWTSNDTAKATMGDSAITAKGRVTGVATGTTTISAKYLRTDNVTITADSRTVTVTAPALQSLSLSPLTSNPTSGNQVKYTATATYFGGVTRDVTEDATWSWSIDKPYVAILADSVNQPGQVVAVDSGTATLTASFGGKTATVPATITVP